MAAFGPALLKVLRHEGVTLDSAGAPVPGRTGLVNHPDDPGGETNYGITIAEARRRGWAGPMKDLPFALVQRIYREDYWDQIKGDQQPDQKIAEEMMDTAVNCGVGVAVRFLQMVLNGFNQRETLYPDLPEDGVFGPKTLETLARALGVKPWYRTVILRAIDNFQGTRYFEISRPKPGDTPAQAERRRRFETFLPGWYLNRIGVADGEPA